MKDMADAANLHPSEGAEKYTGTTYYSTGLQEVFWSQ